MESKAAEFVDVYYVKWLFWLFFPLFISFLLPLVLCLMVAANAVFLHVYKLRHRIRAAYNKSVWDGAKSAIASFWDAQGWVFHGYEVYGMEHIPNTGPALIIYYHGTMPWDVYYLQAKMMLHKSRSFLCVADNFLWKIPGFGLFLNVFQATPGDRKDLVSKLKRGQVICISPGGVREALFSYDYDLMWGQRRGFVKIALEANVPVIPMFTENCRQGLWTPVTGKRLWRWIYEKSRLPLVPIFGYAPVKYRTYLGAPITFHMRNLSRKMTFAGSNSPEEFLQKNFEFQRGDGNSVDSDSQRKFCALRRVRSESELFEDDSDLSWDPMEMDTLEEKEESEEERIERIMKGILRVVFF